MTIPDRPAYEDLELREDEDWPWNDQPHFVHRRRDPDIAAHSHLGAILIVAAIVGLALIAVALFVRGAS